MQPVDNTPSPAPHSGPVSAGDRTTAARNSPRRRWIRRTLLLLLLLLLVLLRPLWFWGWFLLHDQSSLPHQTAGIADDASRMNATLVRENWPIPTDETLALEQLSRLLRRAHRDSIPVSIAGAQHSMGGHSIARDGIVINMLPFNRMSLDERTDVLTVGAGARWFEVLQFLHTRGRSVAVMQSNNSFSVGGSISVNCHGWQHGRPPIASTVESFRLMLADGSIRNCSRTESQELFSLVLGGYGLFGIILDVRLHVVPNELYSRTRVVIPVSEYLDNFHKHSKHSSVALVYGRLRVTHHRFLEDAVLNVYSTVNSAAPAPPLSSPGLKTLRRAIFRASAGSEYGKQLRWQAETDWDRHISSDLVWRNHLLNESVDVFQNRSPDTTDILHEYFVPAENFLPFLDLLRQTIPRHSADLLNVTIRDIRTDNDSFLRYADQDLFAFVMLFQQPRTESADADMQSLTRELIDGALTLHGRYYLPYRLHATPAQLHSAYPQAAGFFAKKLEYDPHLLFQNQFWKTYAPPNSQSR